MNFGPVSIPDPADYDLQDPAQCHDFYSDLQSEYSELTNMMGGFAGGYAGPMLEEYLNDLGDPVFERLQSQDCADANQNDISDGWELPAAAPDLPDSASGTDNVVELEPFLIEGSPDAAEGYGEQPDAHAGSAPELDGG